MLGRYGHPLVVAEHQLQVGVEGSASILKVDVEAYLDLGPKLLRGDLSLVLRHRREDRLRAKCQFLGVTEADIDVADVLAKSVPIKCVVEFSILIAAKRAQSLNPRVERLSAVMMSGSFSAPAICHWSSPVSKEYWTTGLGVQNGLLRLFGLVAIHPGIFEDGLAALLPLKDHRTWPGSFPILHTRPSEKRSLF